MRNKIVLILALFFLISQGFAQPVPASSSQRATWFKEAKFGMMIHWGLYSILAGSYNGLSLPNDQLKHAKSWYAEWAQQRLEVPKAGYQALVKQFNPKEFDADSWIYEAKLAGMRYFVITAKHHDGFALWDSKVSDYDVMSTPFKRDILGELASACKRYGLKLGFYYSHCEDWEHPGGALPDWLPRRSDKAFEQYWYEKCLPQVKELLTNYQPDMLWFDTWGDEQEKTFISDKRRDELIALIRKESPKTLINGRISYLNPGNEVDFLEMMDNAYPEEIQHRPWQTPATMVNSWGYHAGDYNWKSSRQLLGYLIESTAKGGNYLLNVGPKADGTFPSVAIERLRSVGAWLYANGESIYGASPSNIPNKEGIYFTYKRNKMGKNLLFAHLIHRPTNESLILPINPEKIERCYVLDTGQPLTFKADGTNSLINLPQLLVKPDADLSVIVFEMR